jgi:hypothetical protein
MLDASLAEYAGTGVYGHRRERAPFSRGWIAGPVWGLGIS